MKESVIQKKIQEYVKSIDGYVINVITASRAGVPDLICCIRGKFVAFEVKTSKGVVSQLQAYNISQIRAFSGFAFVVRSQDEAIGHIQTILSGLDNDIKTS